MKEIEEKSETTPKQIVLPVDKLAVNFEFS